MRRSRYGGFQPIPFWRTGGFWLVVFLAAVCAVGIGACASSYYALETATVTVVGKESVSTENGHEYRVYAEDKTYVIKDSVVRTRFNSSDLYRELRQGRTYTCKTQGWRVPLFSMFENLMSCREAPGPG